MSRPRLVVYVSGHGFGHWTRTSAVLARLAELAEIHVRTNGRALGQAQKPAWVASVTEVDVGPGVVQRGPLAVDLPGTAAALGRYLADFDELVTAEAEVLRAAEPAAILADIPPLGLEAAARAGVPGIALANFTWSWIYEPWVEAAPEFAAAVERLSRAEALASHSIRLPGGGGLERLGPASLEAVIRRTPTCSPAEAAERLPRPSRSQGLAAGERPPLVLLSFGGYGNELDLSQATRDNPELDFVSFADPGRALPENLTVLPHDHSFPHQDLVCGADALIAKPGYGTVSECLNRPTPLAYVIPESGFREHPLLVDMIERWLPCAALSQEQLLRGAWQTPLTQALSARPAEPPPPDGLEEVQGLIAAVLAGKA